MSSQDMKSIRRRTPEGTIITDPELLASLRPSRECLERCEQLERATMGRRGRCIMI